jgi:hypothetical protein
MTTITGLNPQLLSPPRLPPAALSASATTAASLRKTSTDKTDELHAKFTQFVGETFFGQMIKAMRSTVGKPAYFHGGRAEEVFQGQLDQALAEHMTKVSAEKVAEPMFRRQFPHLGEALGSRTTPAIASEMQQLGQLSRR